MRCDAPQHVFVTGKPCGQMDGMRRVAWIRPMPTGQSADAIAELFAKIVDNTADITIGGPGLIRK